MSGWDDLVTTALLGTDRRPLPGQLREPMAMLSAVVEEPDPAGRLLDLAATYSMVAKTQDVTAPAVSDHDVPLADLPPAPVAGRLLLTELLAAGDFALVNVWFVRCVDHGCVLGAGQWCTLLAAAARHRSIDRRLLAHALGDQGLWFAGLNPEWAALHRALTKARAETSDQPMTNDETSAVAGQAPAVGNGVEQQWSAAGPERGSVEPATVERATVERATVERVLRTAQPWPEAEVRAGLGASCRAGRRTISATVLDRFALGMPLMAYPMIGEAADYYLEGPDDGGEMAALPGTQPAAEPTGTSGRSSDSSRTAAQQRAAHEVLVRVEAVLHDRIRIERAFGERLDVSPRMIIHHPVRSLS